MGDPIAFNEAHVIAITPKVVPDEATRYEVTTTDDDVTTELFGPIEKVVDIANYLCPTALN